MSRISIALVLALTLANASVAIGQDLSAEARLERFRREFIPIDPSEPKFGNRFTMQEAGSKTLPDSKQTVAVDIEHQFEVCKYEVTQELWELVMGKNPSLWTGPRNSVENLSFDEAVEFCQKVTKLLREQGLIEANQVCRLPTESEWEYVARAGTDSKWSFGDDREQLDRHAWSTHNAAGNDPPVGALKPNPWGLYDVHGYLWEWCLGSPKQLDKWVTVQGENWAENIETDQRILRGGSWKDPASQLQSGFRRLADHRFRDDAVGLRCVISE